MALCHFVSSCSEICKQSGDAFRFCLRYLFGMRYSEMAKPFHWGYFDLHSRSIYLCVYYFGVFKAVCVSSLPFVVQHAHYHLCLLLSLVWTSAFCLLFICGFKSMLDLMQFCSSSGGSICLIFSVKCATDHHPLLQYVPISLVWHSHLPRVYTICFNIRGV